ncbi:MAG: sulfate/thiosulfate ABC transporter permease CysW, partial [Actinomycetota bacterium]
MAASIALQPGVQERYETPATRDPAWIKAVLITVSLSFFAFFLLLPLGTVFAEALKKGWGVYLKALAHPDAWAAIKLTLLTAAIAVPLNLVFGVAAAWAI